MVETRTYGYCRVSTNDQNIEKYINQLIEYGIPGEFIYHEKITGKSKASEREQLKALLKHVRKGDTIVIESLTRLGRSTKDLIEVSEMLEGKGVQLKSIKENIDTTTPTGKAMFGMLAVMAQFERDLISERTKFGLEAARARGKKGGRKKTDESVLKKAKKLYDAKTLTVAEICEATGVSRTVLYDYIRENKYTKM
ncbi:recombinase family protein [Bacillus sp. RG28]|uniref:Recombinase family protein n=1 Tax=Gottfriedia endophytica TaxID=2820819 RepID=A0A940NU15_9BACI|nr:recombinase family protein [Gottfriedia endophytica]MBP0726761.1 recombinase family protein [Gottfriedia endophytica]